MRVPLFAHRREKATRGRGFAARTTGFEGVIEDERESG
jgi:hypothetical protein